MVGVSRAKHGEEATAVFVAELDDAGQRLRLATGLRRALEGDELELHFQPLRVLADGTHAGFEALVRWRPPRGALVLPGEFSGFAETSGLIEPLGAWVLDAACRQLRAWLDAGLEPGVLGVNVSPRQLRRTDVPAIVTAALERHRVDPAQLCVEVTEGALREGADAVERSLERLREIGVRAAIDDFGSDYSSLARLRDLPVQMVKLDRSFLAGTPGDARATELLGAIVGLGRALGLRIVAECVETPEQERLVSELGCTLGQGFALGRPLDARAAGALLAGRARRSACARRPDRQADGGQARPGRRSPRPRRRAELCEEGSIRASASAPVANAKTPLWSTSMTSSSRGHVQGGAPTPVAFSRV